MEAASNRYVCKTQQLMVHSAVLEEFLEGEVRKWCKGKRTLLEVLQALPEILPDFRIPFDVDVLKSEGTPQDAERAFKRMLKMLHPDKLVTAPLEMQVRASLVLHVLSTAREKANK